MRVLAAGTIAEQTLDPLALSPCLSALLCSVGHTMVLVRLRMVAGDWRACITWCSSRGAGRHHGPLRSARTWRARPQACQGRARQQGPATAWCSRQGAHLTSNGRLRTSRDTRCARESRESRLDMGLPAVGRVIWLLFGYGSAHTMSYICCTISRSVSRHSCCAATQHRKCPGACSVLTPSTLKQACYQSALPCEMHVAACLRSSSVCASRVLDLLPTRPPSVRVMRAPADLDIGDEASPKEVKVASKKVCSEPTTGVAASSRNPCPAADGVFGRHSTAFIVGLVAVCFLAVTGKLYLVVPRCYLSSDRLCAVAAARYCSTLLTAWLPTMSVCRDGHVRERRGGHRDSSCWHMAGLDRPLAGALFRRGGDPQYKAAAAANR